MPNHVIYLQTFPKVQRLENKISKGEEEKPLYTYVYVVPSQVLVSFFKFIENSVAFVGLTPLTSFLATPWTVVDHAG